MCQLSVFSVHRQVAMCLCVSAFLTNDVHVLYLTFSYADLTDKEKIWRADMEAWLASFDTWAAHIKSLTGEAPAVPEVDLGTSC